MAAGALLMRSWPAIVLLLGCGAAGGEAGEPPVLPSRGASGWAGDGEVVGEPAVSLSFTGDRLVVVGEGSADADAGHPHELFDGTLFHTCGQAVCRDGVVVLAADGDPERDPPETAVRDPFVRTVTSPLGRVLWDMWYVSVDGDHPRGALAFAGSFDGLTWSRYPDNPVLSPSGGVASPWIREEDDGTALYVVTGGKAVRRVR